MVDNNYRRNGEGYRDDTAFKAICNIMKEERKTKKTKGGRSKSHVNGQNHSGNDCTDECIE